MFRVYNSEVLQYFSRLLLSRTESHWTYGRFASPTSENFVRMTSTLTTTSASLVADNMCGGSHRDGYASSSEEKGNILDGYDDDIVIPVRDHGQALLTNASVKPCELASVLTDHFWDMLRSDVEDSLHGITLGRMIGRSLFVLHAILAVHYVVAKDYFLISHNCAMAILFIHFSEVTLLYNMRLALRTLLHTINLYCRNSVSGYLLLLKTTGGGCLCNSQNYIIFRKIADSKDAKLSPRRISRQETYARLGQGDQFKVTLPKLCSTRRQAVCCRSYDYVDDQFFLDEHTVPPGISAEAWLIFCNDMEAMLAASTKSLPWLILGTTAYFSALAVAGQVDDRRTIAVVVGASICCCWAWLATVRRAIQLSMEKKFERIKTYGNTLFSGHIVTFEPAPICTALCLTDSILFKKDCYEELQNHVC